LASSKNQSAVALVVGAGCAEVNREHIDGLVASLRPFIATGSGTRLVLHGYMPPYRSEAAPDGFIEFWVSVPGQRDVAFSIEFGGSEVERYGFEDLSRSKLESVARHHDPVNLRAAVANFDELWLFACQFAEEVGIASLQLRYGV
jgi:hypothetical protein